MLQYAPAPRGRGRLGRSARFGFGSGQLVGGSSPLARTIRSLIGIQYGDRLYSFLIYKHTSSHIFTTSTCVAWRIASPCDACKKDAPEHHCLRHSLSAYSNEFLCGSCRARSDLQAD